MFQPPGNVKPGCYKLQGLARIMFGQTALPHHYCDKEAYLDFLRPRAQQVGE